MNRRSKNYQVLKLFSFYDDLSVFARFISRVTLKAAQSPQENPQLLKQPWDETVLQLYPELVNNALSEVACWIPAPAYYPPG